MLTLSFENILQIYCFESVSSGNAPDYQVHDPSHAKELLGLLGALGHVEILGDQGYLNFCKRKMQHFNLRCVF